MATGNSIPFDIPSVSSLMQIRTNRRITRRGELALAQNGNGDIIGSFQARKGITQTGNTLQADHAVYGIGTAENASQSVLQNIAGVNDSADSSITLKYNNNGTWSTISGATLPPNVRPKFVSFGDRTYVVGRTDDDSAFVTTAIYNGSTYTETSLPKCGYAVPFRDRLYFIHAQVAGVTYSSRAYFSSIPTLSGGVWTIQIDNASTDYVQIQTDDGDWLTGAAESFGRLLFFKRNSIYSYDRINEDPVAKIGATAPGSICQIDNYVFFLHWSNRAKGMFMWDGTKPQNVARGLEPFFQGMTNNVETTPQAGVYNGHVLLYIGDVTLDADIADYYNIPQTYSNVIVDYNFNNSQLAIHTVPFEVTSIGTFDGNLFIGDTLGKVYQWDLGDTDDGTEIESVAITQPIYGRDKNSRTNWQDVVVNTHKTGNALLSYSIDGSDFADGELGQLTDESVYRSIGRKGYRLQLRVASKHSGDRFILEGVGGDYIQEGKVLR